MDDNRIAEHEATIPPASETQAIDPDALYNEGMTYYRLRRWREAKRCFERLRARDPARRGVEALLRELEIFIQLESVETEAPRDVPMAETDAESVEASAQVPLSLPRRRHIGWWIVWALVLVLSVGAAGGAYLYSKDKLPPSLQNVVRQGMALFVPKDQRVKNLGNLGQAYSVAQQYCKALRVYTDLVKLTPTDPEALNGLERAKAKLYDEALAYIKANNIGKAQEDLQCLCAADPGYKDACARLESLKKRQDLDQFLRQAQDYLGTQAHAKAVDLLLKIRTLDPDYNPGTISDALYEAYLGQARQLVEWVGSRLEPAANAKLSEPRYAAAISAEVLSKARQAIKTYDKALAERANSEQAKAEKAWADRLNQGLERYSEGAWAECVVQLSEVSKAEPGYAAGKLAPVLCDAQLLQVDALAQKGDLRAALAAYQAMAALKACDGSPASGRAQELFKRLTPSATPTITPTPTLLPTNTPRATATPLPTAAPTQTPVPPTSQPQGGGGGGGGGGPTPPPPPPDIPPKR